MGTVEWSGGEFNAAVAGNLGISSQDTVTEYPYAGITAASVSHELVDTTQLSLEVNGAVWLGVDNQGEESSQSTVLRGSLGRLPVFFTRSPIHKNFGINDLSLAGAHKLTGFGLVVAPFYAIEALAYPYIHNSAIGHPSLENAGLDTASPADLYNPYIGPLAAATWDSPFPGDHGVQLLAQTGTAGENVLGFKTLFRTLQFKYSLGDIEEGDFQLGGKTTQISLAVYNTRIAQEEEINEFGEEESPTDGFGGSFTFQVKDIVELGVGYSFNDQATTEEGLQIDKHGDGLTVSTSVPVKGVELAVAYSRLGYSENMETNVVDDGEQKTAEHNINASIVFPIISPPPTASSPSYCFSHTTSTDSL